MNTSKYFPITKGEFPKFITTSLMMVLTIYIYCILRGTKDAMVVTYMGAELISTIKLYGVLPLAIVFMLIYTKMVDIFPRTVIYNIFIWFFVGFVLTFSFVLHPNLEHIHFGWESFAADYPIIKYHIIMVSNWSISLFYIFSELWGSMMLSLMFWQLANQINSVNEAKRFYTLFGFLAQIGMIAAGVLAAQFTSGDNMDWQDSLNKISLTVVFSGALLSGALYVLANKIVGKDVVNGAAVKKKKKKPSLMSSLKEIFSSRYLGLLALLVICYGISINLVEGVWKKQMGTLLPTAVGYNNFMAKVQMYTGIATAIAMLCGTVFLRIFSWRFVAMATPLIILITGAPFFLFTIYSDYFDVSLEQMAVTSLYVAVIFGALQNIFSKAVKYSFFDPTKEMAYIPLDDDLKAKGKGAVDVVGARLGKSGGALIQWFMLAFIAGSTLTSLAPNLFVIFLIVMMIWIAAVVMLSKEFDAKVAENEASASTEEAVEKLA